jgi:hypothetical protein
VGPAADPPGPPDQPAGCAQRAKLRAWTLEAPGRACVLLPLNNILARGLGTPCSTSSGTSRRLGAPEPPPPSSTTTGALWTWPRATPPPRCRPRCAGRCACPPCCSGGNETRRWASRRVKAHSRSPAVAAARRPRHWARRAPSSVALTTRPVTQSCLLSVPPPYRCCC